MLIYKDNTKGILRSRLKHTNHYLSDVIVIIVNTNIKWGKGGEFRQILRKKKKIYLL
jgi:small nuclear ribonucleoprotein (snRNP)-like protein